MAESSDCCTDAAEFPAVVVEPPVPAVDALPAAALLVVVLVPAWAIELYKPAASYTCAVVPDAVPKVATMPDVVDNALACCANPGSVLATTGELALPEPVVVAT